MIFKVCSLLNEDKVCEAQSIVSTTINKLLQEQKYSLIDLILHLFIKNSTIPEYILLQLLEETKSCRDKLPHRKKMEEILQVCV